MVINLSDYSYELPDERIAQTPLKNRDEARLLVYEKGSIRHNRFRALGEELPRDSFLVFNDTRVVHARIIFNRKTGAAIEVFILNPLEPFTEMAQAMSVPGTAVWECMIGNARKWKTGEIMEKELPGGGILKATLLSREGRNGKVQFEWTPAEKIWSQILDVAGRTPLPPYIHHEPDEKDEIQYQTVYAKTEGAVAAPTAGLHFTEEILAHLKQKDIGSASLTLHVSAGTFQPVAHANVLDHPMHNEQIILSRELIGVLGKTTRKIIAVGTTSARSLESVYWFGHMLLTRDNVREFFIEKLYPYPITEDSLPSVKVAFQAVLDWMDKNSLSSLTGRTEILILPGYRFQVCRGLVTNFHLPGSTLILLVAALIGEDWRKVYQAALDGKYRFLSYGDGSLLLP